MTDYWFMQCANAACGLRFPLDLAQFSGQYCPRCGGILEKMTPSLASYQPESLPREGKEVVALLDNIRSAYNVGSILRSADGAGISRLYLCGVTSPADQDAVRKTALGAEESVPWTYTPNAVTLARALKGEGYHLVALEATPNAEPLFSFSDKGAGKIALILGSERAGVDPDLIALADAVYFLPMQGVKGSLNVGVAFAIAAYWLRFAH